MPEHKVNVLNREIVFSFMKDYVVPTNDIGLLKRSSNVTIAARDPILILTLVDSKSFAVTSSSMIGRDARRSPMAYKR